MKNRKEDKEAIDELQNDVIEQLESAEGDYKQGIIFGMGVLIKFMPKEMRTEYAPLVGFVETNRTLEDLDPEVVRILEELDKYDF